MRLTAEQIYDRLINVDHILTLQGQIKFYLGDVDIVVHQKDVVGNIIQEWLQGWMDKHGVEYAPNENSQMPPDFFLNPSNRTVELLEVKAFNFDASPGFDIADFNAYIREILVEPYMLMTKYLIFGYVMTDDGHVIIRHLWLKNVWEICRSMETWAINVQCKKNVIHKIRPATWYATTSKFPVFRSLEEFLSAIEQTVYDYSRSQFPRWKYDMEAAYLRFYKKKVSIPRWSDIQSYYQPK